MSIRLTKEQVYERFVKRASVFTETLEKQLVPQYPLICYNRDQLVEHCAQIVRTFIDVVYSENN